MSSTKNEKLLRIRQAGILRSFRSVHRKFGIALFAFFFIVGVTGLLLGWKKHSGGIIQAKSQQGTSSDFSKWLSLQELNDIAEQVLKDSLGQDFSAEVDRIDIRKDKGIVKFNYLNHFSEIQLDGATGKVLSVNHRRSDFIEKIHDGSILDFYLKTSDGQIKLFYTSLMGLGLIVFTITGFWLWYGPKRMRKNS
jgi:uncharacterized iron-regulated membrane protein